MKLSLKMNLHGSNACNQIFKYKINALDVLKFHNKDNKSRKFCGSVYLFNYNFIKKGPQRRCFPMNIAKFSKAPTLKNIGE